MAGRGQHHGRGHGGRGLGRGGFGRGGLGRGRGWAEGTLAALRPGDEVEIVSVDDADARVQALRFGMAEGSHATCVTRIPAGPIVMRSGRQEIAVGRHLAGRIRVRAYGATSEESR